MQNSALNNYHDKTYINSLISNYYDKLTIDNKLLWIQQSGIDLTDYYKKDEINVMVNEAYSSQ